MNPQAISAAANVGSDALDDFARAIVEAPDVQIGAVDLHEAQGRGGALPSRLKPLDPTLRLVGRALTVRFPAGDNLWLHRALEHGREGDVIVATPHMAVEAGYWGEIMMEAARARGISGLVIDGQVRDRSLLIGASFPVFCSGLAMHGTTKRADGPGAIAEPILVGDALVRSGDLIVGDEDGVVVVPVTEVAAVTRAAVQRKRKEVDIIDELRRGVSTMDVYDLPRSAP